MNKYVRLGWDTYCPMEGLGNVLASFSSIEEAIEYEPEYHREWAAIADRDTWEIIEQWKPVHKDDY